MPRNTRRRKLKRRQALPPDRRSRGIGSPPPVEVHTLDHRARVRVDDPALEGTWLVHIAGTTADPSIFPPDRTLPQVAFDFRDVTFDGPEDSDPYRPFHELLANGLARAFAGRSPRHLVFVGHSFGGMVSADFLVRRSLSDLRELVPGIERVTLAMVCAAHRSPMDRYRIRSDAPVLGSMATWLSHHVTRHSTQSKERMAAIKKVMGHEPPKELWREVWASEDELGGVWNLPRGASLDHFWGVVRCARAYDLEDRLAQGGQLWFDLLTLSAELDAQWPADMFEDFWEVVMQTRCPKARWCHFPGDDHLSIARMPTKYYKEIKDFILSPRG